MALGKLWAEFKAFAFKGNMIDLAVAVVIGAAFSGVITSLVSDIIMPGISYIVSGVREAKEVAQTAVVTTASHVGLASTQPGTAPATQPTTGAATPSTTMPDVAATTEPATQPTAILAAVPPGMALLNVNQSPDGHYTVNVFTNAPALAAAAPPPPAAAPKDPDVKAVDLDWKIGRISIGKFIGSLVNFLLVAAAVFLVIVKLLGSAMKRMGGTPKPEEPTVRECPECLSLVPIKARRCSHCTSALTPIGSATAS